jgi:hypothetical protein
MFAVGSAAGSAFQPVFLTDDRRLNGELFG